jgi:hypothetical protein
MLICIEENLYELRSETGKLLMLVERSREGYIFHIKPHGAPEASEVPLDDLLYTLDSDTDE